LIKEEREINDEAIRRAEIYMERNLGEEISEDEYRNLVREIREKIQDEYGYWD
jgi:hypothetical protein